MIKEFYRDKPGRPSGLLLRQHGVHPKGPSWPLVKPSYLSCIGAFSPSQVRHTEKGQPIILLRTGPRNAAVAPALGFPV